MDGSSTLPSSMASSRLRQTPTGMLEFHGIPSGICQNGWNLSFCQIPMESKWNSIPTDSKFIPLDSKAIPTHSNGHPNTFQWIPSAIHMSCDLV